MPRARTGERRKISVLFPPGLLKKVRMVASIKGEPLSQAIVRLTERGLKEEFGDGSVNLKALEEVVGSLPAGGNALKDSEDLYL